MQSPDVRDPHWRVARSDELLRETQRQAERPGEPDLRRICDWLCRHIDAHVALVWSTGTVAATSAGFPRAVLSALATRLPGLGGGRGVVAGLEAGGLHLRLEALEPQPRPADPRARPAAPGGGGTGPRPPRPVLVVASAAPLAREPALLASDTARSALLLLRLNEAAAVHRNYQHKARQVRFAVLQALLAGDPDLARRMTTGAVPELLDARTLRVYLLQCPPGERDRLALVLQDPSGYHDRDLMVQCPVIREHLICLVSEDSDDDRAPAGRGAELCRLAAGSAGYAVGISAVHALEDTSQAYDQARHALAVARNLPGAVASYRGESPLAQLLPRPEAVEWARSFLRPLAGAPRLTPQILRVGLTVSRSGAARFLDVSRNTVAAHFRRAERLLGLDLDEVTSRALLHLALALADPPPPATARTGTAPTVCELIRARPAAAWAAAFLHPLDDTLRTTARAWVAANANAQRTARDLGISRNTVRVRLRTAEALLNRDLLTTGFGSYDLVHAFAIAEGRAAVVREGFLRTS
ncbi:helix-turn-helix domain-containing protein [Streptomyces sp. B22F1]|uniref:helix-turn-helix domain-containing protein n=1 Tax=Streptomyces sp. B22F1 TaxID=3153566 RepID=UPI00325D8796